MALAGLQADSDRANPLHMLIRVMTGAGATHLGQLRQQRRHREGVVRVGREFRAQQALHLLILEMREQHLAAGCRMQ